LHYAYVVEGTAEKASFVLELIEDTTELSTEVLLFRVLEALIVLVEVDAHDEAEDNKHYCEADFHYKVVEAVAALWSWKIAAKVRSMYKADEEAPVETT
jgi:hypothetical protein